MMTKLETKFLNLTLKIMFGKLLTRWLRLGIGMLLELLKGKCGLILVPVRKLSTLYINTHHNDHNTLFHSLLLILD